MKNIAVFCSASNVDTQYQNAASELATLLGKNHYNLVWGASEKGLMKIVADNAQQTGAKLIGITIIHLKEVARKNIDELIIAETLYERKAKFLEKADAFVTLIGGIGTLDEIMEIAELKKHHIHEKPLIILNTNHFYDAIISQLTLMEKEHFFPRPLQEIFFFANQPQEAIDYLNIALHD